MNVPTDDQFSKMMSKVLDELPEKYTSKLDNVFITYEDQPSPEQRKKLKLACNQSLFGLYEGVPLTKRGNSFSGQLPDKITIFKLPLFHASQSDEDLKAKTKHTMWHEIAHYFGLDHDRIHQLEQR
jgi:predicted Zn-dependent protease with MMP-like domain